MGTGTVQLMAVPCPGLEVMVAVPPRSVTPLPTACHTVQLVGSFHDDWSLINYRIEDQVGDAHIDPTIGAQLPTRVRPRLRSIRCARSSLRRVNQCSITAMTLGF